MQRECILKALCAYLNEDHVLLFREYLNCDWLKAKDNMKQTVMVIYIVRPEGSDAAEEPVDIGVVIQGTEVFRSLRNVAVALAMLFGLIYALNLSYLRELKATFEVIQKGVLQPGWTQTFTKGACPKEQDAGVRYLVCSN
ncbi:hypothetical protein QQF64_017642 [Cirrhinus molitorella]|uniref:Uncharacterized protein n=1 Tax=Cirrhinus molitorella TaxID=172907 RepID=A0ABR3LJ70_9TELE